MTTPMSACHGSTVLMPLLASASVPMSTDQKEFARTPALGAMVVSLDNMTKDNEQALLLHLGD
jgi:hypothetical protein